MYGRSTSTVHRYSYIVPVVFVEHSRCCYQRRRNHGRTFRLSNSSSGKTSEENHSFEDIQYRDKMMQVHDIIKLSAYAIFLNIHIVSIVVPVLALDSGSTPVPCPAICTCVNSTAVCSNENRIVSVIPQLPSDTTTLTFKNSILENVTKETFSNNTALKLRALTLEHNDISFISKDAFEVFPSLVMLDLSHNAISGEVLQQSFHGLGNSSLEELRLVGMSLDSLPIDMFVELSRVEVQRVFLHNNTVPKVMGYTFAKLQNLKELCLSYNSISYIDFQGFDTLEKLKLDYNVLNATPVFHGNVRSMVPKLEYLDLGNNKIDFDRVDPLKGLDTVQELLLGRNRIRDVSETTFPRALLQNLKTLDLSNNPFNCTCDLYWFRSKWVDSSKVSLRKYPEGYICSTPGNLTGTRLEDFNPTSEECPSSDPDSSGVADTYTSIFLQLIFATMTVLCYL